MKFVCEHCNDEFEEAIMLIHHRCDDMVERFK